MRRERSQMLAACLTRGAEWEAYSVRMVSRAQDMISASVTTLREGGREGGGGVVVPFLQVSVL